MRYGSCAVFRCGSSTVAEGLDLEVWLTRAARRLLPALPVLVVLAAGVGALWILLSVGGFVGRRYRQVDRLANAASVVTWTATGLVLSDGRSLTLPRIKTITGSARALSRVVERGVEVKPDGRAVVLVRIYSGCGNCNSFKERRWRFDLSALLVFLGLAEPDASIHGVDPAHDSFEARLGSDEYEWGLSRLGGSVDGLESFCRENGVPLEKHVEPEFAGYW